MGEIYTNKNCGMKLWKGTNLQIDITPLEYTWLERNIASLKVVWYLVAVMLILTF